MPPRSSAPASTATLRLLLVPAGCELLADRGRSWRVPHEKIFCLKVSESTWNSCKEVILGCFATLQQQLSSHRLGMLQSAGLAWMPTQCWEYANPIPIMCQPNTRQSPAL